jgi:hypothetical protein
MVSLKFFNIKTKQLQPVAWNVSQLVFDDVVDQAAEGFACETGVAGPATQKNALSGSLDVEISLALGAFYRWFIE